VAGRNILVNAVAPGFIETMMTDELPIEEIKKQIPLRRMGTVDEVAKTVAFLCSEGAGYMTGQVLGVNGGVHM
jgi:3-oxoacyl-[acyl-carrier protein] reductase